MHVSMRVSVTPRGHFKRRSKSSGRPGQLVGNNLAFDVGGEVAKIVTVFPISSWILSELVLCGIAS